MKIVLDLDQLLEDGKITPEEHQRFTQFAARDTGSLAFNLLTGFSVIAICLGVLALVPTPQTAILIGGLMMMAATAAPNVLGNEAHKWSIVLQVGIVIGALMFGGGLIIATKGHLNTFIGLTFAFAFAAIPLVSEELALSFY